MHDLGVIGSFEAKEPSAARPSSLSENGDPLLSPLFFHSLLGQYERDRRAE